MDMSFSSNVIEERDIEVAAQPGHDDTRRIRVQALNLLKGSRKKCPSVL